MFDREMHVICLDLNRDLGLILIIVFMAHSTSQSVLHLNLNQILAELEVSSSLS